MKLEAINIDNMKQIDIEHNFNGNGAKEALMVDYEVFYNNCTEIDTELMANILSTDDSEYVNDVFLYILGIIGNQDIGIPVETKDGNYARDIVVHNIVSGISKCPSIVRNSKSMSHCCNIAMDIVAEFDTVLWDLHKKSVKNDDKQWTTITYARVELHWDDYTNLMAQYQRFRLPLIEKPHDWQVGFNGGYHLNKSNVTTNRGCNDQPQEVLDVLNKLQSQSYILMDFVNGEDEHKAVYDKMITKFPKDKAVDVAQSTCQTIRETYLTMKDREFYFEWRYDFRGRAYNTGYDITLQGSKYKKGSLQATFN